jgi:hypothetical protein
VITPITIDITYFASVGCLAAIQPVSDPRDLKILAL